MEKKIELKHIAPYLPYGLKCRLSHEGIINLDAEYPNEHQSKIGIIKHFSFYEDEISGSFWVTNKYSFDFNNQSEIEIILRPLSDLTKEITDNKGRKFIPSKFLWSVSENDEENFDIYGSLPSYWGINIRMLKNDFRNIDYGDIEKLIEWNFDVFGLIDSGLAIDINTI